MPTLIRIKPKKKVTLNGKKNSQVFGDRVFSGRISDVNGKIHEYVGSKPFVINGDGVFLDLDKPEDKLFYDICMGATIRKVFNSNAGLNYRFDIENLAKEMDDYLKDDETKTELKAIVMKMKGLELRTLGFFFAIRGSDNTIKGSLYKLIDDKKTTDKVGRFLLHKNRHLLNYVYNALDRGNEGEKQGLYKSERGIYYFNSSAIGNSEDEVLGYLKGESEEAKTIYSLLKKMYEDTQMEMNVKK